MLRVCLLGTTAHPSMLQYGRMLERGFQDRELEVGMAFARSALVPPRSRRGKALGYVERGVGYPLRVRRIAADVFHMVEHAPAHLAHRVIEQPTVVTVHDVLMLRAAAGEIPYDGKRWWTWRFRWGTRQLRHATAIACPSATTARDVVELCGIEPARVTHVPSGLAGAFRPLDDGCRQRERAALGVAGRALVLHVSTGGFYKNVPATLRVLAELRHAGVDAMLVRVGRPLSPADAALAGSLALEEHVRELGSIGAERLIAVYNAADALLFPSLYEGFGWPVLEAMACGTPVVCSDTPALAELAGGAAATAPASDVAGLTARLGDVLANPSVAARMSAGGVARAAGFTVERMLDGYERVYRDAAETIR